MTDDRRSQPSKNKNGVSASKVPSKSVRKTDRETSGKSRTDRNAAAPSGKNDSLSNKNRVASSNNIKSDKNRVGSSNNIKSNKNRVSSSNNNIKTREKNRSAQPSAQKSQNQIHFAERSGKYRDSRINNTDIAVSGGGAAVIKKTKPKRKAEALLGFDYSFFMTVIILLAFGLIMMFSASYATAYSEYGDSLYYIKRQAVFAVGGIGIMLVVSVIDYRIIKKRLILVGISAFSAMLMVLVKVMPTEQGGSERWITIGPITFQPSEILKFAVIILFAYFTEKNFAHLREVKKGLLPYAVTLVASCGLLMLQPHLSGTIIVFAIGFVMMFVAGVHPKYLITMLALVGVLLAVGIPILNSAGFDYFSTRWLSFTDPEADIGDKTFQTYQSLVTIGSGGLFGLGFGNSRQKYSYLPMARNDFIFSIICEELGFVGGMLVILLFVILVWRGFYIASKARDKFGMMIAFGITFQIGLQALLNVAVVSNSIPNTGISLPFFSYGGSALVMQLVEMGVLLNISRKAELD